MAILERWTTLNTISEIIDFPTNNNNSVSIKIETANNRTNRKRWDKNFWDNSSTKKSK